MRLYDRVDAAMKIAI